MTRERVQEKKRLGKKIGKSFLKNVIECKKTEAISHKISNILITEIEKKHTFANALYFFKGIQKMRFFSSYENFIAGVQNVGPPLGLA